MLTDEHGAWAGRLLRASAASHPDDEAVESLRRWAESASANGGELLLPAGLLPPVASAKRWSEWSERTTGSAPPASALAVQARDGRMVYLDTAQSANWSFSGTHKGASGAGIAALADTGWRLNQRPDAGRAAAKRSPLTLIRLLAEIERDADTRHLERAFRADPELSYQLLRLLNSAAFSTQTPVQGLAHAIALLGRRQLQRWLQLLIYTQSGQANEAPNPLLQMAAYRGHLLEDLARHAGSSETEVNAAYMTGIFSLLDLLIALPMAQIVTRLPLPPHVAAALASGDGALGDWLALAVSSERGELSTATAILDRLAVSPAEWLQIQDSAYQWAYGIGLEAAVVA